MKTTTSLNALHNMSAPPRLNITVTPFASDPAPSVATSAGNITAPGLGLVAFVDLNLLFYASGPGSEGNDKKSQRWRLERLVLGIRLFLGSQDLVLQKIETIPFEVLQDELRDLMLDLDQVVHALPAFMVVRQKKLPTTPDLPPITDLALALALASRVADRLFVSSRTPRITQLAKLHTRLYFYAAGPVIQERMNP